MKISIIAILFSLLFLTNGENIKLSKSSLKKIDKLLAEQFEGEAISYLYFKSFDSTKDLYSILSNGNNIAFLVVSSAKGRYDYFDYYILYDLNPEIQKIEVLVYRSDHGMEICNKRWLVQYEGMKSGEKREFSKDIDAISGATLSSRSITEDINIINSRIAELVKL
ncbi:MAG: FMN-binding protein [Bacteroidetes bacterium]|nr:FMN-binding protein [Bacteroidota bacterium]